MSASRRRPPGPKRRTSSPLRRHVKGFLFKQDPTRLIKLSTLTGLIFTQLRLAHSSILGAAGTPPRRTSGLIWHATFHPAAVGLSCLRQAACCFSSHGGGSSCGRCESSAVLLDTVGSTPPAPTALRGAISSCQTAEGNGPVLNHPQHR